MGKVSVKITQSVHLSQSTGSTGHIMGKVGYMSEKSPNQETSHEIQEEMILFALILLRVAGPFCRSGILSLQPVTLVVIE